MGNSGIFSIPIQPKMDLVVTLLMWAQPHLHSAYPLQSLTLIGCCLFQSRWPSRRRQTIAPVSRVFLPLRHSPLLTKSPTGECRDDDDLTNACDNV